MLDRAWAWAVEAKGMALGQLLAMVEGWGGGGGDVWVWVSMACVGRVVMPT